MASIRINRASAIASNMESELTLDSCIRGHHVYKNVWTPIMGEQLSCKRETGNNKDRYAVAVLQDRNTVGHLPRKISAACSLFLQRGGSIRCIVTGERCYSSDLPQGGLEVPCMLRFNGQLNDVLKLKKLLTPAGTNSGANEEPVIEQPSKRRKIDLDPVIIDDEKMSEDEDGGARKIWMSDPVSHIELSQKDKSALTMGDCLNDNHINLAQELLRRQFRNLSGLKSTLWLTKLKEPLSIDAVQVLHTRGNHWIVASTIGCSVGEVNVFDSLYSSIDAATLKLLKQIFGVHIKVKMTKCSQQTGSRDCGLFAIANCTALAHGSHPSIITFNQDAMRQHLFNCFESFHFTPFPNSE